MGQKVNPIGLRLGVTNDWSSTWYSDTKSYKFNLIEDIKIRDFLKKRLFRAMISKVVIKRKSNFVEILVYSSKPGIIIGKKGIDVGNLRLQLSGITSAEIKLDIVEVKLVEVNAVLIADNIAYQLKKRFSHRRAMKKATQNALSYGVKGIKISCAGRLGGAEIARTEWNKEGRMPLHTLRANISYACAEVKTTFGIIGIKVWVYMGDNKRYL